MTGRTLESPVDTRTIRVVVIDDHPVVRAGLTAVISEEPDLDVVGEADSAEAGLLRVLSSTPDVVVLDIRLGDGMTGISACRSLRYEYPKVRVVILTSYPHDVDDAVAAGADGVVMKRSDTARVLEAIRQVADGQKFHDPQLVRPATVEVAGPGLTDAERRVLEPLSRGASNDEIAEKLCLSIHTVKSHVRSICDKLGASNRTQAAVMAVRRGLTSTGPRTEAENLT